MAIDNSFQDRRKAQLFQDRVDRVYLELVEEGKLRDNCEDFPCFAGVEMQLRTFAERLCRGCTDEELAKIKAEGGYFDYTPAKKPDKVDID